MPVEKYFLVVLSTATTGITLLLTGYATYISNSVTLLADFLKCLVEFLAILLAFIVIQKIQRSDKSLYNYGYGKLEQLSSTAVAFAMLCSSIVCMVTAIDRMISPEPLKNASFGLLLGILSVLGNGFLWFRFSRLMKREPSPVTGSQATLFLSKLLASFVVVLSLTLSGFHDAAPFLIYSDAVGSLAIALFLTTSAFSIGSESFSDLVDRAVDEAFQIIVLRHLVKYEEAYSGFYGIRSRQVGMRKLVQIDITLHETSTMGELKPKLKEMKKEIEAEIPQCEVVLALALDEEA